MRIVAVNARGRPSPLYPHTVVAVRGDGWYDLEWVARYGDKLPFDQAVKHFPVGLHRETYAWP